MHGRPTPPPLALRLLERACRADEREMVAGDVVELFERRVDARRRWNRVWFWWQTAMFCAWSFIHGRRAIVASLAWRHLMGPTATALRQASRRLIFEWRYAASVVLILGIGIGTAATMLSVVEEVLLRPLAYHEADRLGILHINLGQLRHHPGLSPAEVNDLQVSGIFAAVEAETRLAEASMGEPAALVSLTQLRITPGMLAMLGVQPILGRTFTPGDVPARVSGGTPQRALVDFDTWRTHFGSDPGVVGRVIRIDGSATEVIGVLPPGFRLVTGRASPQRVDIYHPFGTFDLRNAWQFPTFARLKPESTFQEAQSALDALAARLKSDYPQFYEGELGFTVTPVLDDLTRTSRPALRAAGAGVLLLLVVAFANAAALVIARLRGRHRDIAIRSAIGASRGALAVEFILEGALLALCGALAGTLLAMAAVPGVRELMPRTVPRWEQIHAGWSLLMYAGGLSFAGLVFCGLIPVWKVTRGAAWAALRSGTVEGGRAEYPWSRFILVGSQIALTVVLAFGGAQLARSAAALGRVDLGFDGGVLTVRVPYDRRVHDTNAKRAQLYQRIRDRVRQVPGVVAAGVVTHAPLGGSTMMDGYEADLSTEPSFEQSANYQAVTPGYFDAVNIRIIQGRDFTDQEDASLQNVVIVDETLVRTVFPGATDVLGRTLRLGWGLENAPIVGVVAHARTIDVARAVRPQIYVPIGKLFQAAGTVTVRTNGDPRLLATPIASAIEEAGSGRAIAHIGMLSDNVSAATSALRAVTSLVTFLAGFAAALSALGLYLVIAFVVHERRRATAIRAALGATRAQVVWHHLRTGSVVLAVALPAGLLLSLAAAPIFEDLLHGVDRHDPASLAAAVGAALLAGVTGTYFPAHRAARADVVKALHEQ